MIEEVKDVCTILIKKLKLRGGAYFSGGNEIIGNRIF